MPFFQSLVLGHSLRAPALRGDLDTDCGRCTYQLLSKIPIIGDTQKETGLTRYAECVKKMIIPLVDLA